MTFYKFKLQPEIPMRPFLVVVKHKGAFPCKFCAVAQVEVMRMNSRLHQDSQIDLLYLEEDIDPRIEFIAKYFNRKVPTPALYFRGHLMVGATTPHHYRGMLEGLTGLAL